MIPLTIKLDSPRFLPILLFLPLLTPPPTMAEEAGPTRAGYSINGSIEQQALPCPAENGDCGRDQSLHPDSDPKGRADRRGGLAELRITWYSIDNGGGLASFGADYVLRGTIGQPDVGVSTDGGSTVLNGGLWSASTVVFGDGFESGNTGNWTGTLGESRRNRQ